MEPSRTQRLLDAIGAVSSGVTLEEILDRIIDSAVALVDARYGALGVLGGEDRLVEFVTSGVTDEERATIGALPEGRGILGLLIVDPRPLRLRDLTAHPDAFGFPAHHPPMHSFLGVPIRVGATVFGNLYLCEKRGADEFTAEDEALVVALASGAGVAIENSRLHDQLRDVAVVGERERIARDLHDKVIQRLFAAGMGLQSTARLADSSIAARLDATVDDLDDTIREIRATIFALEQPRLHGVRSWVLDVVAEMSEPLGLTPRIHFDGPVDTVIPDHVAEQLVAALREGLSNVAQHARASRVEVIVRVDSHARLRIVDDGAGPAAGSTDADRGRGIRNLAERAGALGGVCTLEAGSNGGAVLDWSVPLGD